MTGSLPQRTKPPSKSTMAHHKMSPHTWLYHLEQALAQTNITQPRLALVGVGHELRGDDAAGIAAARSLRSLSGQHCLILDAGSAPENVTGVLREFGPDLVVIIDTVEMGKPAGTIRLFDMSDIENIGWTTHALSCHLFARFVESELKCGIRLLGIQPEHDVLGAALSPRVSRSVARIAAGIKQIRMCH